jgi:hypothetical protein
MNLTGGLHRLHDTNVTSSGCRHPTVSLWTFTLLRSQTISRTRCVLEQNDLETHHLWKSIYYSGMCDEISEVWLRGVTFKRQHCFGWVAIPPFVRTSGTSTKCKRQLLTNRPFQRMTLAGRVYRLHQVTYTPRGWEWLNP